MSTSTLPDERIGPWGIHLLEADAETTIEVGPLLLHLRRRGDEIHLREQRENEPVVEEPEWTRWATAGWSGGIELSPTFPDRAVVVEPEEPFHLLPGAEARIYVRVALWVRVDVVEKDTRTTLATIPSITSSDTWWGSLEEGELCYWVQTHARRVITADLFENHLAICPLQLQNRSSGSLPVEKVALRVGFLTLYAHDGSIWADETSVRYQGDVEGSRLDMAGTPPREVPDATLLAPPRTKMARGFKARTFHRLRSLQGWL